MKDQKKKTEVENSSNCYLYWQGKKLPEQLDPSLQCMVPLFWQTGGQLIAKRKKNDKNKLKSLFERKKRKKEIQSMQPTMLLPLILYLYFEVQTFRMQWCHQKQ